MSCRPPAFSDWGVGPCRATRWWGALAVNDETEDYAMDRHLQRQLGRRDMLRRAAMGAGAVGLGLTGASRFATPAWAQDATPEAAQFDAAACYPSYSGA